MSDPEDQACTSDDKVTHLPECFMAATLRVDTYAADVLAQMKRAGCICNRLRAREARVLDAARNAVQGLNCPECSVDAALAAIDAIRQTVSANGVQEGRS